ncbi:MAG: TolC family protein [Candidatus Sericytochromatia bacterium]|nr:TolC family protein [Candidatus Tanganyikabacteria bacterium]
MAQGPARAAAGGLRAPRRLVAIAIGYLAGVAAPAHAQAPWTLERLLDRALAANPYIAVKEAGVRAAEPRPALGAAWPEPMFTSGLKNMGLLPSLGRDPGTELSLGLAQTIPFPGKARLRGEAAAAGVDRARADLAQARRDVVRQVKEAWYDLYDTRRALEINAETRALLARAAEAAAARYRVGKVSQGDVLRAEVEGARMSDDRAMLEARLEAIEANLARLVGLPPLGTSFGPVATPDLRVPDLAPQQIAERVEAGAPALEIAAAETRAAERSLELARLDVLPDLTLMGQVMSRGAMAGGWELSASVDLPVWYRQKQRQMVAEAEAMVAQMRRDREKMLADMLAMAREELAMARSAATRESLLRTSILPRARLTLQAGLAGYAVGMDDFLMLLEAIMTIQGFQREHAAALVAGNKALARLEALLTQEVTREGFR